MKTWAEKVSRRIWLIPVVLIFVSLATSPDIFLSEKDDRNFLLISILAVSSILYLFTFRIYKSDMSIYLFLLAMLVSCLIVNRNVLNIYSLAYTFLFVFTFLFYKKELLRGAMNIATYIILSRYLIYVYFLVLIFQQLCVMLGFPIPLAGNYNVETPWKLSSIAAEPSHTSLNVVILMYSYIVCREISMQRNYHPFHDLKNDFFVWVSFLWIMISSNSASAVLLAGLLIPKFLRLQNLIFFTLVVSIFWLGISYLSLDALERAKAFAVALVSFDISNIISADHSGSYRIIPAILIFLELSLLDLNQFFGNGMGYVSEFLYKVMPGTPIGYSTGGVMVLWAEQGLIPFSFFIIFCLQRCVLLKRPLSIAMLFIALFLSNGINTQTVWFYIFVLFTIRQFAVNKFHETSGSFYSNSPNLRGSL